MQLPDKNTPVSKCIELATFSARMLGKFPERPVLLELAARMSAVGLELEEAQAVYLTAARAILPLRVDVRFANYVSDRRIRQTQQRAELFDGRRNGPVATALFPEGSATITRLVGDSQVQAMRGLEGRLKAASPQWPEAAAEEAAIAEHRKVYEDALTARREAGQAARDKLAQRNATKERYLTTYAEIVSRVEAEFPRDKQTQELFFDTVRTPSVADAGDTDGGDGDGDGENGEGSKKA